MNKLMVLALAGAMLAGCGHFDVITRAQVIGSGKKATETRAVAAFKRVQLDGSMDADITVGKSGEMKVEGDDNIVPLVKTEVKGDTLRIYCDASTSTKSPLKITLSAAELEGATINGSGDLDVKDCAGKRLDLEIRGSGDVRAQGSVELLEASIKGSGSLALFDLKATDANVSIAGSGGAEVTVSGNLDASIAGSGDITYKGNPQKVSRSVAGSGEIHAG